MPEVLAACLKTDTKREGISWSRRYTGGGVQLRKFVVSGADCSEYRLLVVRSETLLGTPHGRRLVDVPLLAKKFSFLRTARSFQEDHPVPLVRLPFFSFTISSLTMRWIRVVLVKRFSSLFCGGLRRP